MSPDNDSLKKLAERTTVAAVRLDRRNKVWLLLVSLATLAVLVTAALKENVFAPWREVQLEYRELLQERATDNWGRNLSADFEVRIKQNAVPALGTTDRCISCHNGLQDPRMADAPQPHRAHSGDYLTWHEPARFGCTICHRGQGQALTFPEAAGHGVHWDYPLLPVELTASSCGLCHALDEVRDHGAAVLVRGRELYEVKGCPSCHKLEGRGGSLGPALDGVGSKVTAQLPMAGVRGPHSLPQWLTEHFDAPQRVVADSQMKPAQLDRQENRQLTATMLSLQRRELPGSYLTPGKHLALYRRAHPQTQDGEQLYRRYCSTCHDDGTYSPYDTFFSRFIPAVRGPTFVHLAEPAFVERMLRDGRAGTLMPGWGPQSGGLTDTEIALLRDYLLATDAAPTNADLAAIEAMKTAPAVGSATLGAPLFARHCSACHGELGRGLLGPSLVSPSMQAAASDGFLYATVAHGRRNTAMPGFLGPQSGGLSPAQIAGLVGHLRSLPGAIRLAEQTRPKAETKESTP